jgi:magnesium-protoporphyrin IX monomethyl ester (oxidative) cyclase
MKILLIFPPQNLEERYSHNIGNVGGFLPPLGLCSMAAVLEKENHEVRIMDCPVNDYRINHILDEIRSFQPGVVGLAAITSLADVTKGICDTIKKEFPAITIMVGGPHANQMPEDLVKEENIDIVMKGEADGKISEIVTHLKKYKEMKFVDCGKVMDLDSLPYPARHLVDMNKYTSLPNTYKTSPHVFQVMTSRGCPFFCVFCSDARGIFRQRSVAHVIGELKQLINDYHVKEIAFWDDAMTVNKKWVHEFCDALEKENLQLIWSCYTRLNLVDKPLLEHMKKTGCWNIFYGIEAGDQELLDNINKKMTLAQMKEAVRWTQEAGIEIRGSFMIGLPGETPEKARKTIDFAIELDPDYAQFSITTPYPGTELWNTYEKWGTLDKTFKNYHGWMPVFLPYGYKSKEELMAIHKEAFRRFYMRPKYILKRIAKIRNWNDIKRYMNGAKVVFGMLSKEKKTRA